MNHSFIDFGLGNRGSDSNINSEQSEVSGMGSSEG